MTLHRNLISHLFLVLVERDPEKVYCNSEKVQCDSEKSLLILFLSN